MRRIRKIAWVFCVLTTAASILLVNVPVMACACPDTKPVAADADEGNSTCCCGNHCCSVPEDQPPCCQPQSKPATPDEHDSIQAPDCPKAATPQTDFSLNLRETTVGGVAFQFVLVATVAPNLLDSAAVTSEMHWHVYQPPPAPDLVIVLQHFVI